MTIGIAAAGSRAGEAVWRALNRVERVSSGMIGGFATFGILTAEGQPKRYCTQRGGSETLFVDGETVLESPPDAVSEAPVAGVISSGPDRPEPLSAFLPVEGDGGLVTGHRFPNAPDADGEPLNRQVMASLSAGDPAPAAVERVTDRSPTIDAGLIAVDTEGRLGMANTAVVSRREDVASARRQESGARIGVLCNSIYPGQAVADLAAAVGCEVMANRREPDFHVTIPAGLPVDVGDENRLVVEGRTAVRAVTTDATVIEGRRNAAVPYRGSEVVEDGVVIGTLLSETNTLVEDGTAVSFAGQRAVELPVRSVA